MEELTSLNASLIAAVAEDDTAPTGFDLSALTSWFDDSNDTEVRTRPFAVRGP